MLRINNCGDIIKKIYFSSEISKIYAKVKHAIYPYFEWIALISFIPVCIALIYFFISIARPNYWNLVDYSYHIANIYAMKTYGFHNTIQNINYGFENVLFLFYPPFFAFVGVIFLNLFDYFGVSNPLMLSAIGVILFSIFCGIISVYLNRDIFKNTKQSILFYFLAMFNFISLGIFLKIGRLPDFFGMNLFIYLFLSLMNVIEKNAISKRNLLNLLLLAPILMITHQSPFIFFTFLTFSIILFSKIENRILLLIPLIITAVIDSFFLIPYFKNAPLNYIGIHVGLIPQTALFYLLSAIGFILFCSYIILRYRKYVVFIPLIIVAILSLFGLGQYIPILNKPIFSQYVVFFLIILSYFFVKSLDVYGKYAVIVLVILLFSNIFSFVNILTFADETNIHNTKYGELFTFSEMIDGPYMGLLNDGGEHPYFPTEYAAYVAYNTITFNLTSLDTWFQEHRPLKLMDLKNKLLMAYADGNCTVAQNLSKTLGMKYAITNTFYCKRMNSCNLIPLKSTKNFCLFKIK